MGLRDVVDDGEAESGAGQTAGAVGPVEAVEHATRFVGGDAGPPVVDGDRSPADAHLDGLVAVGVELGGVLQQIAHRAFEALGAAADHGAVGVDVDQASAAPVHAPRRSPRHLGQVHGFLGLLAAARQGQFDEFVDEVTEFARLVPDVVEEPVAGVG